MNAESIFALAALALIHHRGTENTEKTSVTASLRLFRDFGALVLMTGVGFYRTIDLYFLSDDFFLLNHAKSVLAHPWAQFTTAGGDGFYRPVGYLLLAVTSIWAGIEPSRWHFAGLTIHAVNAGLVLLLASRLGFTRLPAWLAAAVFVVHGTRPESVVWLAGRFDLVSTLFVLLGLLAFLRGWHWAAIAAMAFGIAAKESAYVFPLLLLLFERRRLRVLVPYFGVAAALLGLRLALFQGIGGYSGGLSFLPAVKALILRLWAVLFFPIDWAWPVTPVLGIAAAVYCAGVIWMFMAGVPRERVIFAIGFTMLAALPPVQQLLIGPDMQKSRLLYLPSIGFCLLIGAALEQLKPRAQLLAVLAVMAFQFAALWHNSDAWRFASEKAKATCEAEARSPGSTGTPPGSVNGVYLFANAFAECVEFERAKLR